MFVDFIRFLFVPGAWESASFFLSVVSLDSPAKGSRKCLSPPSEHHIHRKVPCPSFPCLFGFPWLILSKESPCSNESFLFIFQGFRGYGRSRKSLVNLRFFLDKT